MKVTASIAGARGPRVRRVFGIPAPELGNGRLGWIRDDRTVLDVSETHYSVDADASEQDADATGEVAVGAGLHPLERQPLELRDVDLVGDGEP